MLETARPKLRLIEDTGPRAEPTPLQAFLVLLILAGLTLILFARELFSRQAIVVSDHRTDIFGYFLASRSFGFDSLRHGRLPAWDPHVFSGMPYVADFQSALFYPPNWLFLALPLAAAINWNVAFHVFLGGFWTAEWARRRCLGRTACLVSGALYMFGGAAFYKVFAGHLTAVDAMAWAPLALMALDRFIEERAAVWCLPAAGALALQLLAGHPQTFFNTAIAMALCAVLGSRGLPRLAQNVLGLAGAAAGALLLAAVQILPSLQAAGQSTRGAAAVPLAFAGSYSLPPDNLISLIAPGFFGNLVSTPYWGRWLIWEVTPFIGVSGLLLAILGAARGPRPIARVLATAAAILLVLAMGSYTPLFGLLYHVVPGFGVFRADARFAVLASLLAAMLAGLGVQRLQERPVGRAAAWAMAFGALALGGAALALWLGAQSGGLTLWSGFVRWVGASGQSPFAASHGGEPLFIQQSALWAAASLAVAAGTCLLAGLLLCARRSTPRAARALAALAIVEVLVFAHSTMASFPLKDAARRQVASFLQPHPGDYRILDLARGNGYGLDAAGIWGDNPAVPARYEDFIRATQPRPPGPAGAQPTITRLSPLFALLRCRYAFAEGPQGTVVYPLPDPLPHVLVAPHWQVIEASDRALATVASPGFDPRREVVLEADPGVAQSAGAGPASASVLRESDDSLLVAAQTQQPAILLVTDPYCAGWQASGVGSGEPRSYPILPADYVLRGIPIGPGRHVILLRYRCPGYAAGLWTSLSTLAVFAGLLVLSSRRTLRRRSVPARRPARTPPATGPDRR